jgi:hypothetical protein
MECGASVSTNALARAAHERGFNCFLVSTWKGSFNFPSLGDLIFMAKGHTGNENSERLAKREEAEKLMYAVIVELAGMAPARLTGRKRR